MARVKKVKAKEFSATGPRVTLVHRAVTPSAAPAPAKKGSRAAVPPPITTDSTHRGAKSDYDADTPLVVDPAEWCFLCRDGGDLKVCDYCKKKAICTACIAVDKRMDKDQYFCPECHDGTYSDYMTLVETPNLETISTFRNDPIALITLYLDLGNSNECALSVMVEQGVLGNYACKKGEHAPVRAFQSGFRAVPDEDGGPPHMPDELITKLAAFSVHIKDIQDVVLVLQTHSDTDSGGLHFMKDAQTSIFNLLNVLLGDNLLLRLKAAERSVLILVSCGYIWTEGQAEMKECIEKGIFADVIGFTANNLMPLALAPWLCLFFQNYLFGNGRIRLNVKLAIAKSLAGQEALGAHTSVIHITNGKPYQTPESHLFVWAPKSRRPWGIEVPICEHCGNKKKSNFKTPPEDKRLTFLCKNRKCKKVSEPFFADAPPNMNHIVAPSAPWMHERHSFYPAPPNNSGNVGLLGWKRKWDGNGVH